MFESIIDGLGFIFLILICCPILVFTFLLIISALIKLIDVFEELKIKRWRKKNG